MKRPSLLFSETVSLWGPVLAWAGLIYYFSSIPDLRITEGPWDFVLRKIAHMGVFGILARLIARALTRSTFWSWKRIFAVTLVTTVLYACSDEIHQHFVSGRHGSPLDVLIDGVGAWTALGFVP